MFLSLEILTSILGTGLPILVELINLVNYVMFLCQMILLRWLTFLFRSQTVILSPALLDLFISFDTSICSTMAFPSLGNSDHVVVSVSIDFPSNSKRDAPFHRITILVLIGMVFVIIWEMFHGRISLNLVLLLLLVNFVSGFRLELMYIFLIENIRSSLTHLYGFQLLVLLP